MPDATPILALPIPVGTDAADAPTDFESFALRVEELLLGGDDGAAGFAVGDFKTSARTTSHGRWLLCDQDRELTQVEIETELGLDAGQADEIVTILGTGSSSAYGSAATGKVKIPGFRDKVALIAGPTHPRKGSGSTGGEETHTLSTDEIPSHGHGAGTLAAAAHTHGAGSLAADAHQHGAGTLGVASHTHAAGTLGTDNPGGHTHGPGTLAAATAGAHTHSSIQGNSWNQDAFLTEGFSPSSPPGGYYGIAPGVGDTRLVARSAGAHAHDISGASASGGGHTHDIDGSTASSAPAVNGSTASAGSTVSGTSGSTGASVAGNTANAGGGSAHNLMQPYRVVGSTFLRV
jgi:hypothetical protein